MSSTAKHNIRDGIKKTALITTAMLIGVALGIDHGKTLGRIECEQAVKERPPMKYSDPATVPLKL